MSGRPSRLVVDLSAAFSLAFAVGVVYLVDINLPQTSRSRAQGGGAGTGRGNLLGNPIRSDSIYAQRAAPKKQRVKLVKEKGGTAVSEKAVRDGLDWLSRHQKDDGSWSRTCLMAGPDSQCDHDGHCSGPGNHFDMAHTGLVVLAFQGGGHFHFNKTKYSQQVRDGLEWIVKNQKKDGGLYTHKSSHFMYEHGIATFAILEACALDVAAGRKPPRAWRRAGESAVRFIEKMQHNDGGWRYSASKTSPSDTSVSGWQVLALKTALEAGIDFDPKVVPKAKAFFESCEQGRTGITNYTKAARLTHATTGVGMLAHQFLFGTPDSRLVKSASGVLADFAEATYGPRINSQNDYYLWYNCTLAMFQAGGDNWKRWNNVVRDKVVGLQEHDGCARGSWPPNSKFGGAGGRIYSTALAVLSLEVYYRFRGTKKKKGGPKGKLQGDLKKPRVDIAKTDPSPKRGVSVREPQPDERTVQVDPPQKPVERTILDEQSIYAQRATQDLQRQKVVKRYGGNPISEKSVQEGLAWLARHQGGNGAWSQSCMGRQAGSRCEDASYCKSVGGTYDMAHTGLAVLAFQGGGHFYFNGTKYSKNVRTGLQWIVEQQKPDGGLHTGASNHFMYEHGIATFALTEACALDKAAGRKSPPEWRAAAERAVRFIEVMQNNDGGWRYSRSTTERSDVSITGWQVLALKTATEAEISYAEQVVEKARVFFQTCEIKGAGETGYTASSNNALTATAKTKLIKKARIARAAELARFVARRRSRYYSKATRDRLAKKEQAERVERKRKIDAAGAAEQARLAAVQARLIAAARQIKITQPSTTGIGMLAHQFLFATPDSRLVRFAGPRLADYAEVHSARGLRSQSDYYLWYNGTLAMFHAGGDGWKRWNGVVRDRVISLQKHEGCERGSWAPDSRWGSRGGRIYTTALAVLTLEVYYRFRNFDDPAPEITAADKSPAKDKVD